MEDFYHSRSDANRALSRTWKRELKDVLLKKSLRVLMEFVQKFLTKVV